VIPLLSKEQDSPEEPPNRATRAPVGVGPDYQRIPGPLGVWVTPRTIATSLARRGDACEAPQLPFLKVYGPD
jgi:hypothetical protein